MIVVRFDEPQEYHAPGQETRRARVFIDEQKIGKKDVVMGMSIYGPGMAAPFHTHTGSETMFIVHGKGRFGTRDDSVEVSEGDVLYFPAGEEHFLENIGSRTLEFIFVYSHPGDVGPLKEKWLPLKK
ncbi:MAG: cupin domain-containing protein [Candidatus Geothermarchaeales archaeon]